MGLLAGAGIGQIIGIIGSIIGAVGGAAAAAQAAAARRESKEISLASQRLKQKESRRKAIRERRIRAAKIEQSAALTGVAGSSGELGAKAALTSNLGGQLASNRRGVLTSEGITKQEQLASDADARGAQAAAFGQVVSSFGSLFG